MITKACPNCSKEFKTYPSIDKKHCSKACELSLKKKQAFIRCKCTCKVCDKEFMPPRPAEGGIYCSYECMGIDSRAERVDRNGYWYVCVPDHPRASKQGYVPEHHLVVEADMGCYLPEGMVVHHKDEDKRNNDIGNLVAMTDSAHKSFHARQTKRKPDGRYKQEFQQK